MANVFISYRQIDTEPAEKLASELAHTGRVSASQSLLTIGLA